MTEPMLTVRFFARFREELETDSLALTASDGQTVDDILVGLARRGGRWSQLKGERPVMVAVNQVMVKSTTKVKPGDEVAFFPPVTGG